MFNLLPLDTVLGMLHNKIESEVGKKISGFSLQVDIKEENVSFVIGKITKVCPQEYTSHLFNAIKMFLEKEMKSLVEKSKKDPKEIDFSNYEIEGCEVTYVKEADVKSGAKLYIRNKKNNVPLIIDKKI